MTGNQDNGALTGRSIDAIDVMLAQTVTRAATRDIVDETAHVRGLTLLAAAARGVAMARAAQVRAERLVLKAVAEIGAAQEPAMAGEHMDDEQGSGGDGDGLERKRATLFRELDAIIGGRAGLGFDAAPDGRGVGHGRPALVAEGEIESGRGLAAAAA
jgi:hypothetical protein